MRQSSTKKNQELKKKLLYGVAIAAAIYLLWKNRAAIKKKLATPQAATVPMP